MQNGTCSTQLLRLPLRITRKTHSCVLGEKRVNMYIFNGNRFLTFVTLSCLSLLRMHISGGLAEYLVRLEVLLGTTVRWI